MDKEKEGTLTEARSNLIKTAATLLLSRLPEYRDDYPKSVPKYIVDSIREHNETLRVSAINLKEIADSSCFN